MQTADSIFEQAGIAVPKDLTDYKVKTVFAETGLDWTIKQYPVFAEMPIEDATGNRGFTDDYMYSPLNYVANFRSDNNQFLGIVHPKKYKVVNNLEAFNFIDELPNFTYEKVGMFEDGRKVFVVGKADEKIYLDGQDDPIDFYLTFLHGHDGKSGIRFILSPIRMFCMNQMNLMLQTATFKYATRHTGIVERKLETIQAAIANSHNYVIELESTLNSMINTKTDMTIDVLADKLIPDLEEADGEITAARKEQDRQALIDIYNAKDDLQNYKGTVFGMLSAVSDFISHAKPKRNSNSTINNAFVRNLEGNPMLEQARMLLAA